MQLPNSGLGFGSAPNIPTTVSAHTKLSPLFLFCYFDNSSRVLCQNTKKQNKEKRFIHNLKTCWSATIKINNWSNKVGHKSLALSSG